MKGSVFFSAPIISLYTRECYGSSRLFFAMPNDEKFDVSSNKNKIALCLVSESI